MPSPARCLLLGCAATLIAALALPSLGVVQAAPVSPRDTAVSTLTLSQSPQSLVVDDSGTHAYVVTWQTYGVYKVRLSDFTIDDSMTLPSDTGVSYPGGRAVALHGNDVYVTTSSRLYRMNAISLPNSPDDSVAIPAFGQFMVIAWPYAYITHHADNDYVTKVDLPSMTVVSSIASGGSYPMGIALDDTYAYVVNTISSTLSRIRLSDFSVQGTLVVGQQPYGVAIDSAQQYAYVPTASDASWGVTNPPWLVRVNLSTFSVDDTVLLPFTWGYGVTVNPQGTTAYVTQSRGGNQVAKVALGPHMSVEETIAVGAGPQAVTVSPTLPYFYTADANDTTGTTITKVAITVVTPSVVSLSRSSGPVAGGEQVLISGTRLSGATSVHFGSVSATILSGTDDTVAVTVPAAAGAGPQQVTVTTPGGTSTDNVTYTYLEPPPAPAPASPPAEVGSVTAIGGDRRAVVSWSAPVVTGDYPVSTYQVEASPGGATCLSSTLSCTVTGLRSAVPYTFRVRALSGAGWGAWSAPSAPVTPHAAMIITGTRTGNRIVVTGRSTAGDVIQPWVRLAGEDSFAPAVKTALAANDGTFTWSRRSPRAGWVYVTCAQGTSNTVAVRAR